MAKCLQVMCMNVCVSFLSVTLLLAGITSLIYAVVILATDINPEFRELAINQTFTEVTYGLIFLFMVFVLLTVVGCFTHIKKNNSCMFIFFILLVITCSVILLCSIILITVGKKHMKEAYELEVKDSMTKYGNNEKLTNKWDQLQSQQRCCGYSSSTDWNNVDIQGRRSVFPDSCCLSMFESCGQSAKTSEVFQDGCEEVISRTVDSVLHNLFVSSLGFSFAMIIAMVFTLCVLCRSDESQQETEQITIKMEENKSSTKSKGKLLSKEKLKNLFRKEENSSTQK
ncbi:CD63 antigen-like [Antedon mediterranea]|uniref:CD63 antigen-like n=1 Tax=Antedon mediterranea TaxID=105859 RepID=UPI003AF496A4